MKANPKTRFLSYNFLLSSPNITWHSMVHWPSISHAFATSHVKFLVSDRFRNWSFQVLHILRQKKVLEWIPQGRSYVFVTAPIDNQGHSFISPYLFHECPKYPVNLLPNYPASRKPLTGPSSMITWKDLAGFPFMKFCVFNPSIDPSGHYTNQNYCTYRLWEIANIVQSRSGW